MCGALGRLTTPEQFGRHHRDSRTSRGRVTRSREIGRVEMGSVDYGSIAYADRYASAPFWVIAHARRRMWSRWSTESWGTRMGELKKSFPPGY